MLTINILLYIREILYPMNDIYGEDLFHNHQQLHFVCIKQSGLESGKELLMEIKSNNRLYTILLSSSKKK